jgi:hypothetical protein
LGRWKLEDLTPAPASPRPHPTLNSDLTTRAHRRSRPVSCSSPTPLVGAASPLIRPRPLSPLCSGSWLGLLPTVVMLGEPSRAAQTSLAATSVLGEPARSAAHRLRARGAVMRRSASACRCRPTSLLLYASTGARPPPRPDTGGRSSSAPDTSHHMHGHPPHPGRCLPEESSSSPDADGRSSSMCALVATARLLIFHCRSSSQRRQHRSIMSCFGGFVLHQKPENEVDLFCSIDEKQL